MLLLLELILLVLCIIPSAIDSLNVIPNSISTTLLPRSTQTNNTTCSAIMNDSAVLEVPQATPIEGPNELSTQEQQSPQRHHHVCVMVEPSPFTYISGYANRFQQLLQYIQAYHNRTYQVDVITTEVVAVSSPLPTFFGNATATSTAIPIHYCSGIPLPFYPTMSVVSPYFWKNNLSSIMRRIHLQQQQEQKLDLIHVSSPGFMIFYAIFYSRYYSIPLLISYHTHLPIYIQTYIPNIIISPIIQWIGMLL
jgi:sulfoquinovosyltransferase